MIYRILPGVSHGVTFSLIPNRMGFCHRQISIETATYSWPLLMSIHIKILKVVDPGLNTLLAQTERLVYKYSGEVKVTRYLCFRNSKNLHPLDILGFNSANKDGLLPESQTRMSRGCRFLLFLKHRCLVTLNWH